MEPDYYSILRVPPDANIESLKHAYRKRALECHPDRGGSHEQMIRVNEAWFILSDETKRRHYDSAQVDKSNYEVQRTARKDAEDVRQRAEQYPRKWGDFEEWFNRSYGTTSFWGARFPTGGDSAVRWLFIIAGCVFGFFMAVLCMVALGLEHGNPANRWIAIGFLVGGAWLGVLLHYVISHYLKRLASRGEERQQEQEQKKQSRGYREHEVKEEVDRPSDRLVGIGICSVIAVLVVIGLLTTAFKDSGKQQLGRTQGMSTRLSASPSSPSSFSNDRQSKASPAYPDANANNDNAFRDLILSAERGNADDQNTLGAMYFTGKGMQQDYTAAVEWFRKSAEQGNAMAQRNLGALYTAGEGVPKDYLQAHMWLSLAASQGLKEAIMARDEIARVMTPQQISQAEKMAKTWQPKKPRKHSNK